MEKVFKRTIRTKKRRITTLWLQGIVNTKQDAQKLAEQWKREGYRYVRTYPIKDSKGRPARGIYVGN